jgi:rubredoxin---NAD+ reductase
LIYLGTIMKPIVIIGSGMAAYSVARELRKIDKSTPLLIITADDGGFYSKPMLSNAIAQGKSAAALISQTAAQMAEQVLATILTKTTVEHIDTTSKVVVTSNGNYEFSQLVLAVGAQANRLPMQGNAAERVLSVNHVTDYGTLREQIDAVNADARVTIIGAGLIGCEFADDLSSGGHAVTLVDPNPVPLSALAPNPISQGLHAALLAKGVTLRLGTTASSVDVLADGKSLKVTLANGDVIETDVVLSAIGLRADLRVAQASGITTDRGIVINQFGQTSAEHVYALGDCAQYTISEGGNAVSRTLPYIAPILTAARALAKTLTGTPTAIEIKPTPVIVKTPSYSIALIPPPIGAVGHWKTEQVEQTTVCRFENDEGRLLGFALAPQEAKLRNALLAELD